MWSSGVQQHNNKNIAATISSSSKGLSRGSSSSSTSSSPSPFSRPKSMEEVWKDINLASLHEHPYSRDDPHSGTNFNGMILQDLLGRPFSKDPSTSTVSARYGSPVPSPATMLTLNSGHEHLRFLGNHHTLRENPLLQQQQQQQQHQPVQQQVCPHSLPFDALALASGLNPNGKKRFPESDNDSGDRRNKRMIKNRESAARSRARKQAYTNELELEVANLLEENARLKKQQQQLCLAAAAQLPKKYKLHRTSTAPF